MSDNARLTQLRTEVQTELAAVKARLVDLRGSRTALNEQIKAKVAERDELTSALKKLGGVVPPDDEPDEDEPPAV